MDRNRPALTTRLVQWAGGGLRLVPLLFLGVFFFYPLGAILQTGLAPNWQPDLGIFVEILQESYYRKTLWFTIWQAALSTLLTIIVALPAAHVFSRYQFPAKRLWLALATLPFVLPTVVVAAAFEALLGDQGMVNTLWMKWFNLNQPPIHAEKTLGLILLAHVFYNYAVAVRIISSFWALQNQRIQEAAQLLGASGWTLFRRITLPLLMPAILAAGALVFIFTFTSFGVVLLLGGMKYATLEVEIYIQTTAFLDLSTAGALSVIQLLTTIALMAIYTRWQNQIQIPLIGQSPSVGALKPKIGWEYLWIGLQLVILIVLIFAPIAALVERSLMFDHTRPSLQYFAMLDENRRDSRLAVAPMEAIRNSLQFAVVATSLAVGIGMLAAYLLRSKWGRWLDALFMLPLATSAVTLGFGYIIALDEPPLNLRQSFWIIPIAHSLVAIPFVLRSVIPALNAIRPSIPEAAQVLGASQWTIWRRIELPLIARSVIAGAIFAFSVSMGEFGASTFLARTDQPTLPIAIARLLGLPGVTNYGQALAMSVILVMVCAVGFIMIELLNRRITRT